MEVISPAVSILPKDWERMDTMYEDLESAGRTCYKSEDKITPGSAVKFVQTLIKRGHEAMIEHEKITARVICDRGVTHEIVRHRIASYAQESTRYVNYAGDHIKFILPCWSALKVGVYSHSDTGNLNFNGFAIKMATANEKTWVRACLSAEHSYKTLIANGWVPQQARSVLPNSLKTEIVITMNLREWRHFFKLRCSKKAHPQMQEVANMLHELMMEKLPIMFGDVGASGWKET